MEAGGPFLKPAAFRGQLCFGPSEGRYVRFTSPRRWLGEWDEPDPEKALREVTRRYLAAHSPATREDYARWWGGASPAGAQRLIEGLGDEVVEVEVEGSRSWMPAESLDEARAASPSRSVRLLPGFDHWVIAASREPGAMLDEAFRKRVYRSQGWISPVLLVSGRMEGVWRHERKGRRLEVSIEPFGKLPKWARSAAEEEAGLLASFLGGELELSWG